MTATTRDSVALQVGREVTKDVSDEEMNEMEHDPKKMAAYVAGLMPPPLLPAAQVDLGDGRSQRTIDFHGPDGEVVTRAVCLARGDGRPQLPVQPKVDFAEVDGSGEKLGQPVELPMLEPMNGPDSDASAASIRANPNRRGGAEIPDHLV